MNFDQDKTVLDRLIVESMYFGASLDLVNFGDDILGYFTDESAPGSNFIGFTTGEIERPDEKVLCAISLTRDRDVACSWICENERESHVAMVLENLGFYNDFSFWGLVHDGSVVPATNNRNLKVEEVEVSYARNFEEQMAIHLGCSLGYVQIGLRDEDYPENEKLRAFAVFADSSQPAGFGFLVEAADSSVGVMRMAVVFPEFRNRGIYRELTRVRLQEAHNAGLRHVVCHAYESSTPMLENFGMVRYKHFTIYSSS